MDLRCRCPNWRGGCQFKEGVSKVYRQHLPECQQGGGGGQGPSKPAGTYVCTWSLRYMVWHLATCRYILLWPDIK